MVPRTLLRSALLAFSVLSAGCSGGSIRNRAEVPLPDLQASDDPATVAHGRYLVYGPGRCSACHGAFARDDLAGNTDGVPLTGGLVFDFGPFGKVHASNLTSDEQTGVGRRTDAQLARALRHGVTGDDELALMMVFEAIDLSDEDLVAVISYLRTLEPQANEVPPADLTWLGKAGFKAYGGRPKLGAAPAGVPASDEPSAARGEYLANSVAGCVICHSPYSTEGGWHAAEPLAGGAAPTPDDADPKKVHVAPNLTSHATGVSGRLTEDQFVARMRAGRAYPTSRMPWESFQRMSDSDLRSVYRYLRALPPVDNDVGPTWRDKGWKPGRDG